MKKPERVDDQDDDIQKVFRLGNKLIILGGGSSNLFTIGVIQLFGDRAFLEQRYTSDSQMFIIMTILMSLFPLIVFLDSFLDRWREDRHKRNWWQIRNVVLASVMFILIGNYVGILMSMNWDIWVFVTGGLFGVSRLGEKTGQRYFSSITN